MNIFNTNTNKCQWENTYLPLNQKIRSCLKSIRTEFRKIRKLMKKMGELASVDIESDFVTGILDATMECRGVIAAATPGGMFGFEFTIF